MRYTLFYSHPPFILLFFSTHTLSLYLRAQSIAFPNHISLHIQHSIHSFKYLLSLTLAHSLLYYNLLLQYLLSILILGHSFVRSLPSLYNHSISDELYLEKWWELNAYNPIKFNETISPRYISNTLPSVIALKVENPSISHQYGEILCLSLEWLWYKFYAYFRNIELRPFNFTYSKRGLF